MSINLFSKPAILDWVNGVTISAGQALGLRRDDAQYEAAHTPSLARHFPVIHYVDNGWHWGGTTTTYNTYHAPAIPFGTTRAERRQDEEEQTKKKEANWAKIAGAIIMFVGAFAIGFATQKRTAYQAALAETTHVRQESLLKTLPVYRELHLLAMSQQRVDQRNCDRINKYFFSAIAAGAAGVALLAGGLATSMALIVVGKVVAVAAIAFALYTLGVHWSDDALARADYHRILPAAEKVRAALHGYTDDMRPLGLPPAYAPQATGGHYPTQTAYAPPPPVAPGYSVPPTYYAPEAGAPPPYTPMYDYPGGVQPSAPPMHA